MKRNVLFIFLMLLPFLLLLIPPVNERSERITFKALNKAEKIPLYKYVPLRNEECQKPFEISSLVGKWKSSHASTRGNVCVQIEQEKNNVLKMTFILHTHNLIGSYVRYATQLKNNAILLDKPMMSLNQRPFRYMEYAVNNSDLQTLHLLKAFYLSNSDDLELLVTDKCSEFIKSDESALANGEH